MPTYLIQGFFFQGREWLDTEISQQNGDLRPIIRSGLCRYMYSGVIYPDKYNAMGGYAGQLTDHFGDSTLSEMLVLPELVKFTKKYTRRDDLIYYQLKKVGDLWIGEYSGTATGSGTTQCIITEVNEGIFFPPKMG